MLHNTCKKNNNSISKKKTQKNPTTSKTQPTKTKACRAPRRYCLGAMLGVRWLGWWTGRCRHQRDLGYQHLGEDIGGKGNADGWKAGKVGGGDGEWGIFFLEKKKLNQVSWWFIWCIQKKTKPVEYVLFVQFFFWISWFKLESGAQAWRTRCACCCFFFGGLKLYTLDFLGKTWGDSCGSCWGWVVSFEDFPSHPRQAVEKVFGPDNFFGSQSLKNSFSTKRKHAFSG